ncbi:MAG: phenylalanine--tRNA ligase subunit alpha [Alphaproteobacteria bacterium]|nr:phenylalanine--tRNA ligase subunit alpha [Alphaproteobacteria bacterium]
MSKEIINNAKHKISLATSLLELENIRLEYLGKKGVIAEQMKLIGTIEPNAKKAFGEFINNIKSEFEETFNAKKLILEHKHLQEKLEREKIDITLPAFHTKSGSLHPIIQAKLELTEILGHLGFITKEGPSIETQWYNFSALNIDENHPARQSQDTFYIGDPANPMVLRTHTSPVQIRTLESCTPPLKFIAPGRTYRSELDQTHTPMFHQIELMAIDKGLTMRDLKTVILQLISVFFDGQNPEVRFRPSFFPFTTPSAEVDIKFSGGDWLEVLGCGMVHPNILKNCGIDASVYTSYAAGLGIERMAMLKYGIKDLRQFFEGDSRWLSHYNFSPFDIPSIIRGLAR